MSNFYFEGKRVEEEFRQLMGGIYSSNQEDIHEHWDLATSFGKVDVKGLKAIKRRQPVQDEFIWVELKNVRGNRGWLYGDADFFAFKTFTSWLICPRIALQTLVEEIVNVDEQCYPPICCIYQRKDRKDQLTLIPTNRVKLISYEVFHESQENN